MESYFGPEIRYPGLFTADGATWWAGITHMRTKEIRFRLNKIAHMSPFNANRLTATRKVPVCAVRPSVPTRREGKDFREYR